jgi:predicted GNAT family acetyltransferase
MGFAYPWERKRKRVNKRAGPSFLFLYANQPSPFIPARKADLFHPNPIAPMAITHNAADQEFTTVRDGFMGELAYARPADDVIDFTHTFVDENLRGQGVADELARAALDFARQEHLKIKTSCTFMRGFVKRHHAEYADILA